MILVVAHAGGGGPLMMAEVDERLTEVGIDHQDDDAAPNREIVSPPADWVWAEQTCPYVLTMIEGWKSRRVQTPTIAQPQPTGGTAIAAARTAGAHPSG
jgi:hypothetical protein